MSHALECPWDMYAHPMSDPHTYRTSYFHLGRVHTCEEWGSLWRHLPGADVLAANQILVHKIRIVSLSFFRAGTKPEWEDPANHRGTTLSMRAVLPPAKAKEAWTSLCADCARGAADDVVGVQVSQKWGGSLKMDVWLRADCDVAHTTRFVNDSTALTFSVAPREERTPRKERTQQEERQVPRVSPPVVPRRPRRPPRPPP